MRTPGKCKIKPSLRGAKVTKSHRRRRFACLLANDLISSYASLYLNNQRYKQGQARPVKRGNDDTRAGYPQDRHQDDTGKCCTQKCSGVVCAIYHTCREAGVNLFFQIYSTGYGELEPGNNAGNYNQYHKNKPLENL